MKTSELSKPVQDVIDRLQEASARVNTAASNVYNKIETIDTGDPYQKIGEVHIKELLKHDNKNLDDHVRQITALVDSGIILSSRVDELINDEPTKDELKIKREWKHYWVDESRKWISWLQQLIRWGVGGSAAIVLYSLAVWLSENYGFFHVPIHDWIVNKF